MSLKKLDSMLKKLNEVEKDLKSESKGGFLGLGHDAQSSLAKSGGRKRKHVKGGEYTGGRETGGKICKDCMTKMDLSGGFWPHMLKTAANTIWDQMRKQGHGLMGGALMGGNMDNFAGLSGGALMGGAIDGFDGLAGGALMGGNMDNFAGLSGGVLMGGAVDGFDGLAGGRKKKHHVMPSHVVLTDKSSGRMRSDLRSYNSSMSQRGVKPFTANKPYGWNESDVSGGKKKASGGAVPKQLKHWHAFVAKYKKMHPELPYKEVMKKASAEYKK